MPTLPKDINIASRWIIECFASLNKKLDYSMESLKQIDTFFNEQVVDGKPKPHSILENGLGKIIFALGAYVGETLIKNSSGSNWVTNDNDAQGEINISVKFKSGAIVWPAQRIMKRLKNGQEDSIFSYASVLLRDEA